MTNDQKYHQSVSNYWAAGYPATNVESWIFRPYARIFEFELGFDKTRGKRLLDFGCGQGAALNYFRQKGLDVFGVDISETDLQVCKSKMPEIAENILCIEPKPKLDDRWFGAEFDLIVSIQTLYYLSRSDFDLRIKNLYQQLKPGGYIYVSMMGTKHWFYNHATACNDGLHKIEIKTKRVNVQDYYLSFVHSEQEMLERFSLFKRIHLGYYDCNYREDEGSDFHYTFVGQKV